jgi:LmbE family N-acetylglucosaminyl deacetylase
VLVVAPHPDDEVLGCGGTLVRHCRSGDRVTVVCVTDGRGRPDTRADPEAYARCRRDELERAAGVLGVERLHWLGLPEWCWKPAELPPLLAGLLTSWSPDLLYLPSRVDFHPEHRRTAQGAALTLGRDSTATVRVYQVTVPLTAVLVNLVCDTSSVASELTLAVEAHESQRETLLSGVRLHRYAAACHRRQLSAEEYWEMPAARYRALHRDPPDRWFTTGFRGLRRRPLSDPLAYLVGRRARRELAAAGRRRDPQLP